MANVTLAIDDELLKRARIKAIEQGTSVNAVVRSFLETYVGPAEQRKAMEAFIALADRTHAGTEENRLRRRSELYEERTAWPRS